MQKELCVAIAKETRKEVLPEDFDIAEDQFPELIVPV